MSAESRNSDFANRSLFESLQRWSLALLGIVCVGLAALGAVVPGLPTTIFLIAACYLFTRSCPQLEKILIRNRFFAAFHPYLDGTEKMPLKAKLLTLCVMWTFILTSTIVLSSNSSVPILAAMFVPVAGVIGSYFVVRPTR